MQHVLLVVALLTISFLSCFYLSIISSTAMLLSKITQLIYCSLPHVPIVLQSIVLEYFGSFYEVELIEDTERINEAMWTNWTRLVPVVAGAMENTYEQEETKQTSSSSSSSFYTRLQESVRASA